MEPSSTTLLLGITYLLVKHIIADYFLQSAYQVTYKGTYGHPGGVVHSAIQAGLTAPVFTIISPATAWWGLAILIGDFIIHYHIDWGKDQITTQMGWKPDQQIYWMAFGTDQLAHILTCIAIIWLLISI